MFVANAVLAGTIFQLLSRDVQQQTIGELSAPGMCLALALMHLLLLLSPCDKIRRTALRTLQYFAGAFHEALLHGIASLSIFTGAPVNNRTCQSACAPSARGEYFLWHRISCRCRQTVHEHCSRRRVKLKSVPVLAFRDSIRRAAIAMSDERA